MREPPETETLRLSDGVALGDPLVNEGVGVPDFESVRKLERENVREGVGSLDKEAVRTSDSDDVLELLFEKVAEGVCVKD